MNSVDLPCCPIPLTGTAVLLPLASCGVPAGFPSPADDFMVRRIDLTRELITHPQATFLLSVSGESMRDPGISTVTCCWWTRP